MLSFKKLSLEWINFKFSIQLSDGEWRSILKSLNRRDKKLKKNEEEYSVEEQLLEKGNTDYHIHIRASKYLKKKKLEYFFSVGYHEDPKANDKSKYSKKYGMTRISEFAQWLSSIIQNEKKLQQIKVNCSFEYHYSLDKFDVSSIIPFGKSFDFSDGGEALGTTSISGLSLDFENSKIGLKEIGIYKGNKVVHMTQFLEFEIDFDKEIINRLLSVSQSVSKIFINERKN